MKYILILLPMFLAACASDDLQGKNPHEFYKEHPVENKVETKYETYSVRFQPGSDRLTTADIDGLRTALRDVSPMAAESVQIQMKPAQLHNKVRQQHITKLMRGMGYAEKTIMFEPSDTLTANDMQINVAYASVVPPHCPDWRKSPVSTHSNTAEGNAGCSSVTNLGLMAADPRDLVQGASDAHPDSARNMKVIQDYHAGTGASASSSGAASTGVSTSTGQ